MSQAANPTPDKVPPPSHFAQRADEGDEKWLEDAIVAYLDLELGPKQREICRSVVSNERTAVIGANGTGKTYITGAIVLAWQTVRYPAISFGTSGTGKKLYRTLCRPIDKLHGAALNGAGLPGEFKKNPPRIDYKDPEHYFEAATPKDAGELEGAHSAYTLAIIEEADKEDVTKDTIDAMRSLIPDYEGSRMLAVGNPPDETDVFAQLTDESSSWNVVRVSSFDSHNVLVETGEKDGNIIDGMATISALRGDWNDYHDEEWPGVEQARVWSDPEHEDFREDLHERWYKRRAGVMPPEGSDTWRPWSISDVEAAWRRNKPENARITPEALGVDVARDVDETVAIGLHGPVAETEYTSQDAHDIQRRELTNKIQEWPILPIEVDAIGKGQPLADELNSRFPDVREFGNNQKAIDSENYRYKWDQGLQLIGEWLRGNGCFDDKKLYEELQIGARVLEFEERSLASRGGKIIEATSKSELKKELGRSPDRLDSLLMALHAKHVDKSEKKAAATFNW